MLWTRSNVFFFCQLRAFTILISGQNFRVWRTCTILILVWLFSYLRWYRTSDILYHFFSSCVESVLCLFFYKVFFATIVILDKNKFAHAAKVPIFFILEKLISVTFLTKLCDGVKTLNFFFSDNGKKNTDVWNEWVSAAFSKKKKYKEQKYRSRKKKYNVKWG